MTSMDINNDNTNTNIINTNNNMIDAIHTDDMTS